MTGNYATNYAVIDRATNTVTNLIWGMVYQEEEFNTETQQAVRIDELAVSIGDSYDGEGFFHEGEPVKSAGERLLDAETALQILLGEVEE